MNKSLSKIIASVALWAVANTAIAQNAEAASKPDYQLFLIGDEMALCSSMAWTHCSDTDWLDGSKMRTDRYINLTDSYVTPLLDDDLWPVHRRKARDDVKMAIEILYERMRSDVVPERSFQEEFTRRATRHLYDSLSEREWNLIVDHLEMPAPQGKTDQARIKLTKIEAKRDILQAFLQQADLVRSGEEMPRIAIAAVGARDPLTAAQPFISAFESLGAQVRWLPIDAAVNAAQRTGKCEELDALREQELGTWKRARVFPELHKQQQAFCQDKLEGPRIVDWADAVFMVGNDANLVRKAMLDPMSQPTDLMTSIYLKMRANKLVVGATSDAMNAMTARSMVASGTSAEALRAGVMAGEAPPFGCEKDDTCPRNMNSESATYHPLGGVGLFTSANLDGQFSELGRHGRLLRVAATTNTPLAVGVDTRTALAVNVLTGAFKVVGERGVFFGLQAQQTDNAVAATFHYLVAGASGRFSDNNVVDMKLASSDEVVLEEPTTQFLNNRGMVDSLRLLCQERNSFNLLQKDFRLMVVGDEATKRVKAGGECQVTDARIGISWQPDTW
jgi:cyanophycinase-like exopeptidase